MRYIIIDPGQVYVYGFGTKSTLKDLNKEALSILDKYSHAASKYLKAGESMDMTSLQAWDLIQSRVQHTGIKRGKMSYFLADHKTKEYLLINELGVEQEGVVDKKDHIKNVFERVHPLED